jgi:hypothetical protein
VQPSVLIERKQRLGAGFKPAAELHVLATLQVAAHRPVITEGTTDPARSLSTTNGINRFQRADNNLISVSAAHR